MNSRDDAAKAYQNLLGRHNQAVNEYEALQAALDDKKDEGSGLEDDNQSGKNNLSPEDIKHRMNELERSINEMRVHIDEMKKQLQATDAEHAAKTKKKVPSVSSPGFAAYGTGNKGNK